MYENSLLIRAHKLIEFAAMDLIILDNPDDCFLKLTQDINNNSSTHRIISYMSEDELLKLKYINLEVQNSNSTSTIDHTFDTIITLIDENDISNNRLQLQRKITSNYHKNLIGMGNIAISYLAEHTKQLFKIISHNPPLINKLYIEKTVCLNF